MSGNVDWRLRRRLTRSSTEYPGGGHGAALHGRLLGHYDAGSYRCIVCRGRSSSRTRSTTALRLAELTTSPTGRRWSPPTTAWMPTEVLCANCGAHGPSSTTDPGRPACATASTPPRSTSRSGRAEALGASPARARGPPERATPRRGGKTFTARRRMAAEGRWYRRRPGRRQYRDAARGRRSGYDGAAGAAAAKESMRMRLQRPGRWHYDEAGRPGESQSCSRWYRPSPPPVAASGKPWAIVLILLVWPRRRLLQRTGRACRPG
jgi:hypothetical protein